MLSHRSQPIASIATAPGRGAVGIVRISGQALAQWVQHLLGRDLMPRVATYLPFPDAAGQPIDQGLAIWFPAPHSYTGEDVLELQAHGGSIVLQLLLARCLEAGTHIGLRLAEPGEFTQRAFLNGKLDLAQAEAVADLINASTETAARSAGKSLTGAFSREIAALRDAIVHLRMLTEASIDFPEEEIDFLQQTNAANHIQRITEQLRDIRQKVRQGALLREGIQVVIAGQPNAGKSSLLNALAEKELAIVTPIAGTTRDKVTEAIQIEGVPLHIVDTAGLRDPQAADVDTVEQIGIARAWDAIAQADAVLFVHDLTRLHQADYTAADAQIAAQLPAHVPVLHIGNKADIAQNQPDPAQSDWLHISAQTGMGIDALRQSLLQLVGWQAMPEGTFMARQRHVQALEQVHTHILQAQQLMQHPDLPLDLLTEELRLAQNSLNTITGEFTSEDLLSEIFNSFCIGK